MKRVLHLHRFGTRNTAFGTLSNLPKFSRNFQGKGRKKAITQAYPIPLNSGDCTSAVAA
jgi:hypothetical protein